MERELKTNVSMMQWLNYKRAFFGETLRGDAMHVCVCVCVCVCVRERERTHLSHGSEGYFFFFLVRNILYASFVVSEFLQISFFSKIVFFFHLRN